MAATFSCAADRKNIGESSCTKGVLENPNQMMIVDENFTFLASEQDDVAFWTAAIKDGSATLFPKIFNFEAVPIEATYEETTFGAAKNNQGKYGWRLFYKRNIEIYKNLVTWDGTTDRIIFFDDQGKMMSTLVGGDQTPATNTYTGLSPQLFSVENQTVDENSTKSPVRILFEDPEEWNVNGFVFFPNTFLSQVKSLSTATLAEVGTSIATLVTVDVTNDNDGSPRRGLVVGDFTFGGNTIDSLTEPSAGQYALVGVGMTTDSLDLVAATSSSQFVESSGAITITI